MVGEQTEVDRKAEWQGWQLQEDSADAYERYLVPIYFGPGAQALIGLAEVKPGDRLLDIACGTGIVARTAAEHVVPGGSVAGVDLNQGMLSVARRESAGIEPAIEWRLGDAQNLPYADATFDVAICQQGLQFIPDQPLALREIHRVLAPGGRLALGILRSTDHNPGYAILSNLLEEHVSPEAGAMMRSPFAPLGPNALRGLIAGAGFQNVQIIIGVASARFPSVEEFVRQEAASSPLAGPLGGLPADVREQMLGDLRQALEPYIDDMGVVFPVELHLATARR